MVHLDTSFLIRALVRHSPQDVQLRSWLQDGAPLGISAVGWAEFLCGPIEQRQVELAARIVRHPVPFRAEEAVLAARLFNLAGRRPGSFTDCMVAATAIQHEAVLATVNASDFRRLQSAGLHMLAT